MSAMIPSDLTRHAAEVKTLWADYSRSENRRVPVRFVCDEQLWLKVVGCSFRDFYMDPRVHLKAQLEGQSWFREHVFGDMDPALPERWQVGVQLWMEENEYFGCQVVYQENDYAWGRPLPYGRQDLLRAVADIDPETRVREGSAFRMYRALRELTDGTEFMDRPIDVAAPGGGTHGVFTKAAEIRGIDQICIDVYEAPDFVEEFLRLVADKTLGRIRAWRKLAGRSTGELPSPAGWSLCDDSVQLLSPATYERFVLPHHERLYAAMTTGKRTIHLCGKASHLYATLRHKLNITTIDGPGPFVDHGHFLRTLGPDLSFNAQTDETLMAQGSEADVRAMMRGLLTPSAKVPGRFNIVGFVMRDTPLHNVAVCYEEARRHGVIG